MKGKCGGIIAPRFEEVVMMSWCSSEPSILDLCKSTLAVDDFADMTFLFSNQAFGNMETSRSRAFVIGLHNVLSC